MELTGFVYACAGGDTFDSIARDLWDDEKYAAELMCANPENCGKTAFLGGERLYIPVVELPEDDMNDTISEPETAPWRD